MKLSFTAIYKLLSVELFNEKNVNSEIPEWLRECFEKPFEGTNAESLVEFLKSVEAPNSGNTAANFFNKRLESCFTDFRIGLAEYLMGNDGQSINSANYERIYNSISEQLRKKIERSRKIGELYSRSEPDDIIIHDIVEKLCTYDLGSAADLCGRIQELNKTQPFSAFMILTIISLFGDKRASELTGKKSSDTILSAQKFDQLVNLLSEEKKTPSELIRSDIVTTYYNDRDILFNEEWRHFLNTKGELTGKLASVSMEKLLQYAAELSDEKRVNFTISNNNDMSIQICIAAINASAGHRSDISVCLYIMRLYSELVISCWRKKDQVNYSRYFEEAREYRRQVLTIISALNPCFDMSEKAAQKRRLLEKQMKNGIPATVTFLHREATCYSYTHQTGKSIETFFNYLSALNSYSGDHIEYVRRLIASAENDLAFVMMKAIDHSNAEKYFDLSLKHREQLFEDREIWLAKGYGNLAQINKIINEFDRALDYAEKVCQMREKLLAEKKTGPGSLMISENTYTDIYIRMAIRENGKSRKELLSKARERLRRSFNLYEMIESSGSKGAVAISHERYIKSLMLAAVINSVEGDQETAISFLNTAFECNQGHYAEDVDEMFNTPFIYRSILIRILLSEVCLRGGMYEKAGNILTELRNELRESINNSSQDSKKQHYTPILHWAICSVLYTIYLTETGADRKEIQESANEARSAADILCTTSYTLDDKYRDNNRKAYGKLVEYADHVLPFIEKGKEPEKEFYSICYLMML